MVWHDYLSQDGDLQSWNTDSDDGREERPTMGHIKPDEEDGDL